MRVLYCASKATLRNVSHKPELLLSFEAMMGSGEQVVNITADQSTMMIRVEDPWKAIGFV